MFHQTEALFPRSFSVPSFICLVFGAWFDEAHLFMASGAIGLEDLGGGSL